MTISADAAPSTAAEAAAELGLTRLRPGQREAIEAAAGGRDVLAALPTGWGKVGHLPGGRPAGAGTHRRHLTAARPPAGPGGGLDAATDAGAVTVSSALSEAQRRRALDDLGSGVVEFVFLAPEQLASGEVFWTRCAGPGRRCSSSTRRTASASGATTSGRSTSAWDLGLRRYQAASGPPPIADVMGVLDALGGGAEGHERRCVRPRD